VQVRPDDGGLPQSGDEVVVDVVDLDRRQPQALDALDRAGGADQLRQPHRAVAEEAEVDSCEDDLAVALADPPSDLGQHGVGAAAPRRAAHERDHAERAGERAAVLDLHERAHAVEPRGRLDAADRADVAGDRLHRLLDLAGDDGHVRREPRECGVGEPRAAAGHEDASVRARRTRGGLARLGEALVGDAARVDDGDVAVPFDLAMAVAHEPLAQRVRVRLRHLAAEEADREARHRARKANDAGARPPPSPRPRCGARGGSRRAAARPRSGNRT
jgi:hypothetical protein